MFVILLSFITLFSFGKLLYLVFMVDLCVCVCIATFHLETNLYFFTCGKLRQVHWIREIGILVIVHQSNLTVFKCKIMQNVAHWTFYIKTT